jgi:hypothetical protein
MAVFPDLRERLACSLPRMSCSVHDETNSNIPVRSRFSQPENSTMSCREVATSAPSGPQIFASAST